MSVTLNATLSDQYANSYVTTSEADTYWTNHYSSTSAASWAALSTAKKEMLLVYSCRVLESLRFTIERNQPRLPRSWYNRGTGKVIFLIDRLEPAKYLSTQSLQFPRTIDLDQTNGTTFIPDPIKWAQCEQCIYLLNFDDSILANRIQGVSKDAVVVGAIHSRQEIEAGGSAIAPIALEMVKPYLIKSNSRIRRG